MRRSVVRDRRTHRRGRPPLVANWGGDGYDDDGESDASLLRGLLTFRDRVAAENGVSGGLAKFNTPARSFDVEFARELQALHLNVVRGESSSESAADGDIADGAGISADSLLLAADGQMRRTLRRKQAATAAESAAAAAAGSLPLLGGRLGFFYRRAAPSPLQGAPEGEDQAAGSQNAAAAGHLAYRTSPDGPKTQRDLEVERLLRSRTPTLWSDVAIGQIRHDCWCSCPTASRPEQQALAAGTRCQRCSGPRVPPAAASIAVVQAAPVSTVSIASGPTAASLLVVRGGGGGGAVVAEPAEGGVKTAASANPAASLDGVVDQQLGGSDATHNGKRRRKEGQRRRKVTGLEMLNSIDAKPRLQSPQPPSPLEPPATDQAPAVSAGDRLRTSQLSPARHSPARSRRRKTPNLSDEVDATDANADRHRPTWAGRTCSNQESEGRGWTSSEMRQPQASNEQRPDVVADSTAAVSRRQPAQPDRCLSQEHDEAQLHQQHQATPDAEPISYMELLPKPDQYRVAHERARIANRNAQFDHWLRRGKDPMDFFGYRTTTGSYSYFPQLPRYGRDLQLFDTAPQYSQAMRQQFYRRKQTPAHLAYGEQNPDSYLPPPIVTVRRRPAPEH